MRKTAKILLLLHFQPETGYKSCSLIGREHLSPLMSLVQLLSDFRVKLGFFTAANDRAAGLGTYLGDRKTSSNHCIVLHSKWQEQSRQLENLPEERLHANSWPPRQLARVHQPPAVLRNHTGTGQEPLLSVKSDVTRRAPSFSSGNFHSSVLYVKSLRTSRLISDSRAQLCWPCRKPAKHTWSVFLKTPTCVPSTPNVSPLCQRISNWHAASEVNVLKCLIWPYIIKRPFLGPQNSSERKPFM